MISVTTALFSAVVLLVGTGRLKAGDFDIRLFALVQFAAASGLIVGAVRLLRRSPTARFIIAGAAGMFLPAGLASHLWAMVKHGPSGILPGSALGSFSALQTIVMPALTMALALAPAAARWCEARPEPPHPVQCENWSRLPGLLWTILHIGRGRGIHFGDNGAPEAAVTAEPTTGRPGNAERRE